MSSRFDPLVRLRRVASGALLISLAGGSAGCYEDLHIDGDEPTDYAWLRVYADEPAAMQIAEGPLPERTRLNRTGFPDDGVAVGRGVTLVFDSLRGFERYTSPNSDQGRLVSTGFVRVPGITFLRTVETSVVQVDNLGDTLALELLEPAGVRVLERRPGPGFSPASDPAVPPQPVPVFDEWEIAVDSDYFECPGEEPPGRFLGWRLLSFPAQTVPLCYRD